MKKLIILSCFISLFLSGQSQTTVVCPVVEDTFIAESAPTSNFGPDPTFMIGKESWGDVFAALIKFDLSSIPSNATINTAYLILNYTTSTQEVVDGTVWNITSVWAENTVTWNGGVWYDNSIGYNFTTGSGSSISIGVHSLVANWIENGMANWGFLLEPTSSSANGNVSIFYSREAYSGSYEPELEVTYTLPEPNLTYDPDHCDLTVNGTHVDIEVRVINNGQGSAGSSHLAYYLSNDNIITTSDWLIGDDYVNSLDPGDYDDESISVDVTTVSPTIPPGTYKVGFIIDYLDEVDESNEDDNWACWSSNPVTIQDNYISVSPTTKTVSSNAGNFSVSVSSNVSWSVSESCYWVTCSPSSGSNNGSFTVNYDENTSSNSRSCTITVSGEGESATITLTQNGDKYLSVSPTTKTVGSNAGNFGVSVSSNVNWSVNESCSWVTCSPPSGSNNGSFTVNYDENTSSNSRSCTITVSGEGESATITLMQNGDKYLSVSPTTNTVGSNAGNFGVSISSNVNWSITESCSWVTCSPSSGSNNGSFTVSYDENTTSNSRSCTITVSGEGENATIILTQNIGTFLSISPTTKTVGSDAGDFSVNVSSNVNWSVNENSSWVTCTPSSGSNNGSFTVSYDENTTSNSRSCTITVSGEGETSTVSLTQEGEQYLLTIDPTFVTLGGYAGSSTICNISSNVTWNIINYPSWLDVSTINGNGDATITFSTNSSNFTNAPRSATLSIISSFVSTQYLTVTQESANNVNENVLLKDLKLYPNPIRNNLNIEIINSTLEVKNVLIYNTIGQLYIKCKLSHPKGKNYLQLSSLPNGIYYLTLITNKGVISEKITVIR